MTDLSKVQPDRDALVTQLQTSLANQDAWKDRVISSTGRTLVDFVAAVGAYSQYSIESALQEAFPESAKNKESLYAASNYAGVRYDRKLPARAQVTLSAAIPQTIPQYSQFTINGTLWFNRNALILTSSPQTFNLFQGKMVENTVSGLGTDFQAYVTPEKSFTVSDLDALVSINGGVIATLRRGLWTVKGQPGCQHFTLPNGQACFLFGNSDFGSKPGINDQVHIKYAVTYGADGNNLPVLGQKVYLTTDSTVTGVVTVSPVEGANETDAFVYKNITPALFGAFDSSITPSQYKALPLMFPLVIDAQTFAQREINPKALTWMNNIRVVLLTTTVFSDTDWLSFVDFFVSKTMYKCQIIRKDPTPITVNVDVDVYCANYSNLSDVKTKVIAALTDLLAPRQGILGFDFYRSDFDRAAREADPNIEYLILNSPTFDVVLSSLNVAAPTLTESLVAGTLPQGVYDYAVSVVSTLGGETAPANWSTITTSGANKKVIISWPAVPNAANYRVWGRITGTSLGLLATVSGSTLTYTDDGTLTPTGTVPVEATIGSYYAKLGTLNVKTHFSSRPVRLIENE